MAKPIIIQRDHSFFSPYLYFYFYLYFYYADYSLGPLMMEMQTMLTNDTVLSAVKTLPKSIKLLKSMAEILTKPEIKQLFGKLSFSSFTIQSNNRRIFRRDN